MYALCEIKINHFRHTVSWQLGKQSHLSLICESCVILYIHSTDKKSHCLVFANFGNPTKLNRKKKVNKLYSHFKMRKETNEIRVKYTDMCIIKWNTITMFNVLLDMTIVHTRIETVFFCHK